MGILDQLREAIRTSGRSRYVLARETGVSQTLLSRLMSGKRGVSVETLELLAHELGYEVKLQAKSEEQTNGE